MGLSILHPRLSRLSCEDCQKWIHDIPSGEPKMWKGPDGKMHHEANESGDTPCHSCPKGGPENDNDSRLTWQNSQLVLLYERVQTGVYRLPDKLMDDPLLADNFSIIRNVMERTEKQRDNESLAVQIASLLVR